MDIALEIGRVCISAERFLVSGHIRPDGDVFGSQLALSLALRQLGKTVQVWNNDGITPGFLFLPGSESLQKPPATPQDFDVFIAVDTATHERLGMVRDAVGSYKTLINIDHHGTNPRYGDLNWIDPAAAATGEIIYQLLQANRWHITSEIATNLFVAISTDTGSFQYSNTTPNTLRIAANLVEAGANVGEIGRLCYYNYPIARFRLLAAVLANLSFYANGAIGKFWLTPEMYDEVLARKEDSEGLIDYVRAIDSVVVAVLFERVRDGRVKISLRSKSDDIRVDSIARQFGGGGHKSAAAATLDGKPGEVEQTVIRAIERALGTGPESDKSIAKVRAV
jgi:phosphoesterase RecJ-like protein